MKFCTVALVLFVSVFATSMAWPARMSYYQQPSFYYQSRASPQRLMYLQYVQQPSSSSSKTHSRLTNSAAAFVAGESVATGTYVKDDASVEQQAAEESVLDSTGANGAQSVAEAYPSASGEVEDAQSDADLDTEGAADVAEYEIPDAVENTEDNEVLEGAAEGRELSESEPEPAVAVPAVPETSAVDLPEDAQNDDDEDEDEDEEEDAAPVSRKPAPKAPAAGGTFFPIDFGGANGGAIAVANSYSTGSKGNAKSQAIAYGKPQTSKSNRRRH